MHIQFCVIHKHKSKQKFNYNIRKQNVEGYIQTSKQQ
jgi:hypothetical protein